MYQMPNCLNEIIAEYAQEYNKLLDWVPLRKLNWQCLSSNPNATHLLEQNMEKINWLQLSENPGAIHLLEQNMEKKYFSALSRNPGIFKSNKQCICDALMMH